LKAAVVIPVYKSEMDKYERISFTQVCKVLKNYPITIACPAGLNLNAYFDIYSNLLVENFDSDYFNGLAGYNQLLLSYNFYSRFEKYNYILIYQLDAFVFRDELEYWCNQGYDFIGAPWLISNLFPWLETGLYPKRLYYFHRFFRKGKYLSKVGNGGFSLRKVKAFTFNLKLFKSTSSKWKANEDNFFSHYVKFINPFFRVASVETALKFSFDIYPQKAFELNSQNLPFGCHAWTRQDAPYEDNFNFWKNKILKNGLS
jgi:hypothetical protein